MPVKSHSVKNLAQLLDLDFRGNPNLLITGISILEKATSNNLVILIDEKYFKNLDKTKALCFLVTKSFPFFDDRCSYLICKNNPKLDMARVLELFLYKPIDTPLGVDTLTNISDDVHLGKNITISPFVHIGKNVSIGNYVTIYPNCYIGDNTIIGDRTIIYPNVTIRENSIIGKKVIINSGAVIGSDGFGFVQIENNYHYKIPQIGNVVIEDEVEIGSNVSIDRGTIDSTIIREGAKIDNLVHIAHNVEIGKRTLVIAQVGIAGSSKIGSNSILAGQAGIGGHLEIGDGTLVYGKSGVTKNFPPKSKISGFPAREHNEELKNQALIKKLPELIEEINKLKSEINFLKNSK